MKNKIGRIVAILALGSLSLSAYAGGVNGSNYEGFNGFHSSFDYTYLEGGYNYSDITNYSPHGDGGYVSGSLGIDRLFDDNIFRGLFITGNYGEDHYGDNKFNHFNTGLNYHTTIARNLDLVGGMSYVKNFSDAYGFAGDLGLRYKLTKRFELNGSETFTGYNDTANGLSHQWTTHGGAVYSFWRNLAGTFNVDYTHISGVTGPQDYTVVGVGARAYF